MSSCNTFPTLTRTDELVTNTLSSSTTTRVTTLPPTTTTFTIFSSCTATATPCSARPIITTSLIPGGSTTIVDTVTFTVPITSSQLTTLWGTSCTPTGQDTTEPQRPTDTFTPPTSTPSPSFFTPPPSIIEISSSSTQADGSVTPVIFTITSTAPPVLVSETSSTDSRGPGNNSDSSKNLGPIIGGVVGGVGGLAAILFLVWFILRRRKRWDDIFDNDDDDVATVAAAARHKEKQADANPKPYQYGLVGHTKSASLTSAPSSPPPTSMTIPSEGGFDQTHHRHSSNAPLLGLPVSMVTPSTSPSPRPPSSAGSMQGYGSFPHDTNVHTPGFATNAAHLPQGQSAWDPNLLYNPAMQQQPPPPNSTAGVASATTPAIAAATTQARRTSHDVDNRAGSPISLQERRILQVTNGGPDYGPQSPETGIFTSPGLASSEPQRDGKGRIVTSGGKAPLVHLDGGRYQSAAQGSSTAGPAPPAYFE